MKEVNGMFHSTGYPHVRSNGGLDGIFGCLASQTFACRMHWVLSAVLSNHLDCSSKPTQLPLGVAGKWKTEWKPIFDLSMEGYSTFPLDLESLMSLDVDFNTSSILNQSFDSGTDHVKSRAQYIWNLESRRIDTWTIGQLLKMVKYSNIARNGTEGNKHQLSPMRFRNYPRQRQQMNDDKDSDVYRETECRSDGAASEEDLNRKPTEREV